MSIIIIMEKLLNFTENHGIIQIVIQCLLMRKISYYYPIYKPSAFSTKIPYGLILEFIPNSNFKGA